MTELLVVTRPNELFSHVYDDIFVFKSLFILWISMNIFSYFKKESSDCL